MRLARLDLLAFGPFRGHVLDFSSPGLHVVYGRNEAGKSTTLRAITGLLYGIPTKTPDGHVHKLTDLRIGGVVESIGVKLHLVRRKGNSNTLLGEDGAPLDDAALRRMLGGVSEETFRLTYGLDHDTLERGARALLEGKGDLGESLFDASVGGGGEVQRLLGELAAEADELFRARASSLPLNEALKLFADAQKLVRERQSLPEAFVAQERALGAASEGRAAAAAERAETLAKKQRLERARKRIPLERRRERAKSRLAELGGVARATVRIEGLRERFSAYEKTLDQRRALTADLERLGERVAEAARRAGAPAEAKLRLDVRTEGRIQKLLGERMRIAERLEGAERERARIERALSLSLEAPPAGLPIDEPRLTIALERARSLGDVEARTADERARLARGRRELEAKAAALGLVACPLEALAALPLPDASAIEELGERAARAAEVIGKAMIHAADLQRDAASCERQIAASTGDFAPPAAADLASARAARDQAIDVARAATREADRRAAEIDVERLLRAADTVADRMIREADRVTLLARLRSELEANAKDSARVAAERAAAEAERAALGEALRELFAPARIVPRGFAEMVTWLDRHAQLASAVANLREQEAKVEDEERRAESARLELAAVLGEGGRLVELVARATERAGALAKARQAAEIAKQTAEERRAALAERTALVAEDSAALAEVGAKLAEMLAPLGVPVDASVDEVNRALEALRELFALVDKRAEADARARVADADARTFEADVARVLTEVAPDLPAVDLREAARALFVRGEAARAATTELDAAEAGLQDITGEVTPEEEALAADPDGADRTLATLDARLEQLDQEISRFDQEIGGLRVGLEEMKADSNAAEAAAEAQVQLARIRELAERYARVKLASVVLAREIERYREENQAPLLASASSLFARLTQGAYSGIRSGFDDKDRPCLRCVRGGDEIDVTGLSDGTRDQLYLSLRLASLLRRAEVAEPMPLVLDDVLIQLDDQRAAAALAVLAEVAQRMQVLFFTHHARLVDLARSAVPKAALVVHELASAGGPTLGLAASP